MTQNKMLTLFCIRPRGFNIGNDAIFVAMQHFIYKAFGRQVNLLSLPATSRYESQAKAGLTKRVIHEINQYGDGVIIGGGNLFENGELDVDLNALGALETPMMVFSVSWGRIYNRRDELVRRTDAMSDTILREVNKRANYSLSRDGATMDQVHKVGATNAVLGGCPTMYLNLQADRIPVATLNETGEKPVLISVRTPNLMNVSLSRQASVQDDVRRMVAALRQRGVKDIRLLCHDHRDLAFAASFGDLPYHYTDDVYAYLGLLRGCALNITYRLHSALPCLSFGIPTIKISYDERALSLFETLGLGAWNINMVTCGDVVSEVMRRYDDMSAFDAVRKQAEPTWNNLYDVQDKAFSDFARDVRAYAEGRP